jgi:hypothetical protein
MKLYSPADENAQSRDEATGKPAPYNWLVMLIILIAYIMLVLI